MGLELSFWADLLQMVCGVQMPAEWMEAKRRAVLKFRSLFIYSTSAHSQEPSTSDAIVDLMCSYAKIGAFQDSSSH